MKKNTGAVIFFVLVFVVIVGYILYMQTNNAGGGLKIPGVTINGITATKGSVASATAGSAVDGTTFTEGL